MYRSTRHWVTVALALVVSACSTSGALESVAVAPTPIPGDTRAEIDADDVRLRVGILAADSMRGREATRPGGRAAARYIADELERLRLRPAGDDGSYLQRVPLERRTTRATVGIETNGTARTLDASEILPVSGLGGLPRPSRNSGSGPLVFGGYMVDPDVGSAELTATDLRDATVIVRLGAAPGVDPEGAPMRTFLATLFSPISPAAAVVLIAEGDELEFWSYAADILAKGALSLAGSQTDEPTAPPFFLVTSETAESLIGAPLESAREPRTDLGAFSYEIESVVEQVDGWNVAAIVPGSDAARADEYVGLGAHYDHVGVGTPVDGDSIYNGADDNASGTSGLLEVAEALAHLPASERPARSTLLVWNDAEESGLLGSEYFTDNPTVPRESIVAHLNVDMIGRNHPDSIFSVGSRRLATELGDIVESVNQRQEQPFIFDYSYDVPGHPEQIYCRSDHYSYARYGIPIVFLTTGLHDDYHAPSDEAHKIDNEKLARVARLMYDLTLELGNRPDRPVVDQPVPPLGAPCT